MEYKWERGGLKEKRVKHDARVGVAIRIKKEKGNRKRGCLKCFLRFLLICDVPPSETTLRNEKKKKEHELKKREGT